MVTEERLYSSLTLDVFSTPVYDGHVDEDSGMDAVHGECEYCSGDADIEADLMLIQRIVGAAKPEKRELLIQAMRDAFLLSLPSGVSGSNRVIGSGDDDEVSDTTDFVVDDDDDDAPITFGGAREKMAMNMDFVSAAAPIESPAMNMDDDELILYDMPMTAPTDQAYDSYTIDGGREKVHKPINIKDFVSFEAKEMPVANDDEEVNFDMNDPDLVEQYGSVAITDPILDLQQDLQANLDYLLDMFQV